MIHGQWSIIYEKAIRDDGSLFFKQRLSQEFLDKTRKSMGSYIFANQYQNECIPSDQQTFKPNWIHYFDTVPANKNTFVFIDPAISQEEHADYTAIVVVHVAGDGNWYLDVANRYKIKPSQLVDKIFEVNERFNPKVIGVEDVAYQKALLYLLDEEMHRRNRILPIKGIRPGIDKTKQMRILGLVPRFEWARLFIRPGLADFETEYSQFPRAAHDDLLDALAYIDRIAFKPNKESENERPPAPNQPNYERWYIRNIERIQNGDFNNSSDDSFEY